MAKKNLENNSVFKLFVSQFLGISELISHNLNEKNIRLRENIKIQLKLKSFE